MAEDISKKTIVVLVILTLAVSLIGTFAVLNELADFEPERAPGPYEPSSSGKVQLKLVPETGPLIDDAGGTVALEMK